MKSIVKTAEHLIEQNNGEFIEMDSIVKELGMKDVSLEKIKARIYTDLMTDGRFFFKDNKVNLTENFTLDEVHQIKSSYSIEKLLLEENRLEEETMNLQGLLEDEDIDINEALDVEVIIEDELSLIGMEDD